MDHCSGHLYAHSHRLFHSPRFLLLFKYLNDLLPTLHLFSPPSFSLLERTPQHRQGLTTPTSIGTRLPGPTYRTPTTSSCLHTPVSGPPPPPPPTPHHQPAQAR